MCEGMPVYTKLKEKNIPIGWVSVGVVLVIIAIFCFKAHWAWITALAAMFWISDVIQYHWSKIMQTNQLVMILLSLFISSAFVIGILFLMEFMFSVDLPNVKGLPFFSSAIAGMIGSQTLSAIYPSAMRRTTRS